MPLQLIVEKFALQSEEYYDGSEFGKYQLTTESYASDDNYHILTITVAGDDLNYIKYDPTLAISNETVFLVVEYGAVLDMAGNPVLSIDNNVSLPVEEFTEDFIQPILVEFNLYLEIDSNALILELVFSETVNASSVDPTGFTFAPYSNTTNESITYTLSGGEVSDIDSTVIRINITTEDLEGIRLLDKYNLFTNPNTSYLFVEEDAAFDMSGNGIVPIPMSNARIISGAFADLNPPEATSLSFDSNTGVLRILFDEPIVASSLVASKLSLHSSAEAAVNDSIGQSHTLEGYVSSSTDKDGYELVIVLTDDDQNEIKRLDELAISSTTTFITFERGLVLDTSLNEATELTGTSPIGTSADGYTQDATSPELVSYNVSLESGELSFEFSETIDTDTVIVSLFSFQNSDSSPDKSYSLTNSIVTSEDSKFLTIQLSEKDSNAIKEIDGLLTSISDTFVVIDREALMDMNRNELKEIFPTDAEAVTAYEPDSNPPMLRNFTIDMDSGHLVLYFNETVRESTLDITQLTFHDEDFEVNYTLTVALSLTDSSSTLNISFSAFDLNELKRLPICTSEDDCYLSFPEDLVMDMVAKPVLIVTSEPPSEFIEDTTSPELVKFSILDFDQELLVLEFSETVDVSSIDFTSLQLKTFYASPISSVNITSGELVDKDSTTITLSLSDGDLDNLKLEQYVCTYVGDCYVGFDHTFIKDMNNRSVSSSHEEFPGYAVDQFQPDTIPPVLEDFNLDLVDGTMLLIFSEPVDLENFQVSAFTLMGAENSSGDNSLLFPLLDTDEFSRYTSRTVLIKLDADDVEELKASMYFKDENTTFLSVAAEAIFDLSFFANEMEEIPDSNGLPVLNFTEDITGPRLIRFDLDYDSNQLVLTFNKPVLSEDFNFTGITIYSNPPDGPSLKLSGGTVFNPPRQGEGQMIVTIDLLEEDTAKLENSSTLASDNLTTFVSIDNDTVVDTFFVSNIGLKKVKAGVIHRDETRPVLKSFALNVDEGLLHLTFDDVVDASTFDARGIFIQNGEDSEDEDQVQLTEESRTSSQTGFVITVVIGPNDLNNIKSHANVAKSTFNTWLTMEASTIDDPNGADVLAITNGKGIKVDEKEFIPDLTPPELLSFTLDLNKGHVILTFDEAVIAETLNITGILLLNDTYEPLNSHSFNADASITELSVTEVQFEISNANLNDLKAELDFGTDENNTYMSIADGTIDDYYEIGIEEVNFTDAKQAGLVIPDTTPPALTNFTLDVNRGLIDLTFSETVLGYTLNASQIILQGVMIFRVGEWTSLSSSQSPSETSDVIRVYIDADDLNRIKTLDSVATKRSNSYLVLAETAITDTSNLYALPIQDIEALLAGDYIADMNNPSLIRASLNLTSEYLTLTFNETVRVSTFVASEITLFNGSSNQVGHTLTGAIISGTDSTTVVIELTRSDLNALKADLSIATNASNTWLRFTAQLGDDMAGNSVVPFEYYAVDLFEDDSVSPILEGFTYDANNGQIILSFSEIVNGSSFNGTAIILQNNDQGDITHYRLTGGYTDTFISDILNVTLDSKDTNTIKAILNLATSQETTYISVESGLIHDMNGNALSETVIKASKYIDDRVRPVLLNFTLDLNSSEIQLTFSETVDASTLNISAFTISSSPLLDAISIHLESSSASKTDSTEITIYLSDNDANNLKMYPTLATTEKNTYLLMSEYAVKDIDSNPVEEIALSDEMYAYLIIPDENPPELVDFSLDMNTGELTLTFNEPVNSTSFDIDEIILQSTKNITEADIISKFVNSSFPKDQYGTELTVLIGTTDLNEIKSLPYIAQTVNDTFISFTSYTIQDMNGNMVEEIDSMFAKQADGYIADETPPVLIAFDIDINDGTITLYFDESVDAESIVFTKITLKNDTNDTGTSYVLMDGASSDLNSTVVQVYLVAADLNNIKFHRDLATSENDTALTLASLGIRDMAKFPNYNHETTISVSNFTGDESRPKLDYWTVDINAGLVTLIFDETVDRSTLNFTALTLQAEMNGTNETEHFTLTTGTSYSIDGLIIEILINETDLNIIKQKLELLRDDESSYISFTEHLIRDMNGNAVEEVLFQDAEEVLQYRNDSSNPRLRDFWFDMDAGTITFSFSETVNASSFVIGGVTLQSVFNITNPRQAYTLTEGVVLTKNSPILKVQISNKDVNELKRLEIARGPFKTYLDLAEFTIRDIEGHSVIPLENGISAKLINRENHVIDRTSPYLKSYNLDLTEEKLVLYFDETVMTNSLNVKEITLQSDNNSSYVNYTLTESSSTSDENNHIVVVNLGRFDLNNIKRITSLATMKNNTFLSHTDKMVVDMRENKVREINQTDAQEVLNFTQDSISPILEGFNISLSNDTLTLSFSETVRANSLQGNQITFFETSNGTGANYTLTGGYSIYGDDPVITVQLLNKDLNVIKQILTLATNRYNTFISVTNATILDMTGNDLIPVIAENGTQVTDYYEDHVRPRLEYFDLDLDAPTLTLYFSETVDITTLDPTQITLTDGVYLDDYYTLTNGSSPSVNDSVIIIEITSDDWNTLKQNTSLATHEGDTYIVFTKYLVNDMNGNEVVPIENGMAVNVTNHTSDTTKPELVSWDLDMDIGKIWLTFSETVNSYSFLPESIIIQNDVTSPPEAKYKLTGGNWTMENVTVICVNILRDFLPDLDDFNELKRNRLIATEENNTYISFENDLIEDMNFNPIVLLPNGKAKRVNVFTNDTTPPYLHAFDIDMDKGTLILTFSEMLERDSLIVEEFSLIEKPLKPTTIIVNITNKYNYPVETPINVTFPILNLTLEDGDVEYEDSQVFVIALTFDDLNKLKREDFCTLDGQGSDCFVSFTSNAVQDMYANDVINRTFDNPVNTRFYYDDVTPPKLTDFAMFDMRNDLIQLQFDETFNISTFYPQAISIQHWGYNNSDPDFKPIKLTGGFGFVQVNDITLQFTLTRYDMNRFKQDILLCVNDKECIVRFTSDVIQDMSRNQAAELNDSESRALMGVRAFEQPSVFFLDDVKAELLAFELDMDTGRVILTFNETVDRTDFSSDEITFYSAEDDPSESYQLSKSPSIDNENWIYINFYLTTNDLIELKYRESLAIDDNTTYLENTMSLIEDMIGNNAYERDSSNRLIESNFQPDITDPRLDYFIFNLGTKQIILFSDEPILLNSTNPTGITLLNTSSIDLPYTDYYTLTGGEVKYYESFLQRKKSVVITLTPVDQLQIQLKEGLAHSGDDVFISITNETFTDMFENPVVSINDTSALQIGDSNFIHDTEEVNLIGFTIDMDVGTMNLTFDDVVASETFVANGIFLQNSVVDDIENFTSFRLSSETYTNSTNGYYILAIFSIDDLNTIKQRIYLATDINDTYITTDPTINIIKDASKRQNANNVVTPGLQAARHTPDTTDPKLTNFTIDLNSGTLTLTFDETVRARSLNISELMLGSSSNFTEAEFVYQLNGGESTLTDLTTVTVTFSVDDLNELKRLTPGLATRQDDSFIAFNDETIFDMNANPVVEVSTEVARQVAELIEDQKNPRLVDFDVDLTNETLTLIFNETVDASTFDVNSITFYSSPSPSASNYNLKSGTHSLNDSTVITVDLEFNDLNAIKSIRNLLVNESTVYISIKSSLIKDMNSNEVLELEPQHNKSVRNYTEDLTPPELLYFDIDLNHDLILLTFSETIKPESLVITNITFINNQSNITSSHTLSGGNQTFDDVRFLNITLNKKDSDRIRFLEDLLTSKDNSYIVFEYETITDMNDNPIESFVKNVEIFTADLVEPYLLSFDLNLHDGILILYFSETMQVSSLNPATVTFYDGPGVSYGSYKLKHGEVLNENDITVQVKLHRDDLNELKRLEPLITGENYTYISLTNETIRDMNNNNLSPVYPHDFEAQVRTLTPDGRRPSVESFEFDLDNGEFNIRFNETVNAESLQPDQFTVHSSNNVSANDYYEYNITDSSYTNSSDSTEIILKLSTQDLNAIKRQPGLATSYLSTYLTYTSEAIEDMFENKVNEVNLTKAETASYFNIDRTPPELDNFSLDINNFLLTLTFSETVNASTLNIKGITLYDEDGSNYTLANPHTSSSTKYDHIVYIDISRDDMNAIKAIPELATSRNNTFIRIESKTISDMSGLRVQTSDIIQVLDYKEDTVSPVLYNFTLNLTSEIITLTFDETVNSTIIINGLLLFPTSNETLDGIFLDGNVLSEDSEIIEIMIDRDILHLIKQQTNLATNSSNTYLRIKQGSVKDMSLLQKEIALTHEQVDVFYPDLTSPKLLSFSLDLTNETLILEFDEPVLISSLNVEAITFQAESNLSNTENHYTLTGGYSNSTNGLQVKIILDDEDVNLIKRDERLAIGNETTFISFSTDLITDMNGIPVLSVPSYAAKVADLYITDSVRPKLESFNLDMNNGQLTLVFSETMNVSSLYINQLTLQLNPDVLNPLHSYTLTDGNLLSKIDSTDVYIQITDFDLNEIKRRGIALGKSHTWLTFPNSTIEDMVGEKVIGHYNGLNEMEVDDYTEDSKPIQLLEFRLDLTEETILLIFSEAVNTIIDLDVSQITLQSSTNVSEFNTQTYRLTSTSQVYRIVDDFNIAFYPEVTIDGSGSGSGMSNVSKELLSNTTVAKFIGSFGRVLQIKISTADLNKIKLLEMLSTEYFNAYISITNETVLDTFGNPTLPISSQKALRASSFVKDRKDPVLESFDIDLSADTITLHFSESIRVSTLNISAISLQGSDPSNSYTLTDSFTESKNGPIIVVNISMYDSNQIRNSSKVAISPTSTYIKIYRGGVTDMNMNNLPETGPIKVSDFTKDEVSPYLKDFSFDLDAGVIVFTFSETVDISSFEPSGIILQNTKEGNDTSYGFESGTIQPYNHTYIKYTIDEEELNEIKYLWDLATGDSDTFVSLDETTITDTAGNPLVSITGKPTADYTGDVTSPMITYFSFDANLGLINLTFSETVNVPSFIPQFITLYSNSVSPLSEEHYVLTGGEIITDNSTSIVIEIPLKDLNTIKQLKKLAVSQSSTFLAHQYGMIHDMANNPILPVLPPNLIHADNFTRDKSEPELVDFTIDLNSGKFTLKFSETVRGSSVNFTQFTLLNGNDSLTLTGGESTQDDSTEVTIYFSFKDLNDLKSSAICTFDMDGEDCYITFTDTAITDTSNNYAKEVIIPFNTTSYKEDKTSPYVVFFTEFNYPNETFTLEFSEVVDTTDFDASQISFQTFSTKLDESSAYSLTGGIIKSERYDHIVTIEFLKDDIDAIKNHPVLCFRRNTCWLTLKTATVRDPATNYVTEIPETKARYSEKFIIDSQSPELIDFTVSMDNNTITLLFNEPVDTEELSVAAITLQSTEDIDEGESLQLTTSTTNSANGLSVVITLSDYDVNRIKSSSFFKSDNDSYISFSSGLIVDTSHASNPVKAVESYKAKQVKSYDPDESGPNLVGAEIDFNKDSLILTFDEPILVSSINYSLIIVQSGNHTLSPVQFSEPLVYGVLTEDSVDGVTVIEFGLAPQNIETLKINSAFATDEKDTFIRILEGAITDTSIDSNENNDGLVAVDKFIKDTTLAKLDNFTFDLNEGLIHLTFNDIVNTSIFDPTGITIQSAQYQLSDPYYTLTSGSSTNSKSGYDVTVILSDYDLNNIKSDFALATEEANTYITVASKTLFDVFGNNIRATTELTAIFASDFVNDTTPPFVENYSLNLTSNSIFLTYSETVLADTFDASSVTLQKEDNGTDIIALPENTKVIQFSNTEIQLVIDQAIVNLITEDPEFGTSKENTLISIESMAVEDTSGILADGTDSLHADNVFPDLVSPYLVNFTLNLEMETLYLTFSETVNGSSVAPAEIKLLRVSDEQEEIVLTGGTVSDDFSTVVSIELLTLDVNKIKELTSFDDLYLLLSDKAVRDMNGNSNSPVSMADPFPIGLFISEEIRPRLLNFTLNLTTETISLTFSETVDVSTLSMKYMRLQNAISSNTFVQFTGGISYSHDSTIIIVELTKEDVDTIKEIEDLGTDENNTFIAAESQAIQDVFGNYLHNISTDAALRASEVFRDIVPPSLISFTLNLRDGELTLYFSETMLLASLDPKQIRLSSSKLPSAKKYELNGGIFNSTPDTSVTITLTDSDIDNIKDLVELAISNETTYITFSSNLVRDTEGNSIKPVTLQRTSNFISDDQNPVLLSFNLDVDSGIISFFFDETIDTTYFNASQITILSGPDSESILTLSGGENILPSYNT